MAASPLVSVIIPTHNRWPEVRDAVDSVLAQAYRDVELLVVDDGSDDGTLERLSSAYPELRLLRQPNAERGAARNRGMRAARGRYVSFLDSDDLLQPWHVAQFAEALERQPEMQVFSAPASLWDPATGKTMPLNKSPKRWRRNLREASLTGTVLPLPGLFVSRSIADAVGGFPEDRAIAGSEDWVFLVRLTRKASIALLPRPSVLVRDHPGRSMADGAARIQSCAAARGLVLREGVDGIPLNEWEGRLVTAGVHWFHATYHYGVGDMKAARRELSAVKAAVGRRRAVRIVGPLWAQTWLGARGSRLARRVKRFVVARRRDDSPAQPLPR